MNIFSASLSQKSQFRHNFFACEYKLDTDHMTVNVLTTRKWKCWI